MFVSEFSSTETANGSWSGMVGQLVRKEADICGGALNFTPRRGKVIDFGTSILNDKGICVQSLNPFNLNFVNHPRSVRHNAEADLSRRQLAGLPRGVHHRIHRLHRRLHRGGRATLHLRGLLRQARRPARQSGPGGVQPAERARIGGRDFGAIGLPHW